MTLIPSNEIKQPQLHADTLGFTFVWQGHFFRGIYPESMELAKSYFESGFLDEVVEKDLFPKTWISDYENEQFGMIIEHEMISPVLYATDWNSAMLKDAALMVLDIAEIGWKYGYNMVDCHKLNVMFKENHPLYVDLGSFVFREEGCTGWKPYRNFLESYTYILDMWTSGCEQLAKRMMSPGVYLRTGDYLAYKYPLFRRMPSLMYLKMKTDSLVNAFAIVGNNVVDESNVKRALKKLSNMLKLGVSQRFSSLRQSVETLKVKYEKRQSESALFDYSFIDHVVSLTCINICNEQIIKTLKGFGMSVISLNENDRFSNSEYVQQKNIISVSYLLQNGSILIRDRYPESRLCSEAVLARCVIEGHGKFALHNSLIYIERCMTYSKTGTIFVWLPRPDAAMTNLLKEKYTINKMSEDGSLLMVVNKTH